MKKIVLAVALVAATGCASKFKTAYVGGAVAKEFVTESHQVYSDELNVKYDECDPAKNPDSGVKTKTDLDECVGDAFKQSTHDKIVKALAAYKAAATVLTAILVKHQGGGATDEELKKAWVDVRAAAFVLLEELPKAGELTKRLKALLGGK